MLFTICVFRFIGQREREREARAATTAAAAATKKHFEFKIRTLDRIQANAPCVFECQPEKPKRATL